MADDDDLQQIVDKLAHRLQRSVAIDDPAMRLLVASRHFGDEDSVRVAAVLNRSLGPEVVDDIRRQGIAGWTSPGRVLVDVPGSRPRLCAPVRCDGRLLGHLWLIETGSALEADEIDLVVDAASRAGLVLFRSLVVRERSRARHETILCELVSSDPVVRARAGRDLLAERVLPDDVSRLQVLTLDTPGGDQAAVALEAALVDGLCAVPGGASLMVLRRSRAWAMLIGRPADHRSSLDAITDRIRRHFTLLDHGAARLVIGIGRPVADLDAVVDSYREALLAARAALLVPALGDVARWGELGAYEVLLRLPPDDLVTAARVPALDSLERQDRHGVLMQTLAHYLNNAGDVRRTAVQLSVHRATLYHRLHRIAEHTGCDLESGDDILTLHLGLKLRDLAADPALGGPSAGRAIP